MLKKRNIAKIKQNCPSITIFRAFSGKHDEVVYILVSIKLHVRKDMDSGHYICDVLDYNSGTWCNCDDDAITHY